MVGNLRKAQKSWSRLEKILVRKGTIPRVSGIFSKAIVQAVLLFGSVMWVMIPHMGRALESFQYRVARWIKVDKQSDRGMRVGSTHLWRK